MSEIHWCQLCETAYEIWGGFEKSVKQLGKGEQNLILWNYHGGYWWNYSSLGKLFLC